MVKVFNDFRTFHNSCLYSLSGVIFHHYDRGYGVRNENSTGILFQLPEAEWFKNDLYKAIPVELPKK